MGPLLKFRHLLKWLFNQPMMVEMKQFRTRHLTLIYAFSSIPRIIRWCPCRRMGKMTDKLQSSTKQRRGDLLIKSQMHCSQYPNTTMSFIHQTKLKGNNSLLSTPFCVFNRTNQRYNYLWQVSENEINHKHWLNAWHHLRVMKITLNSDIWWRRRTDLLAVDREITTWQTNIWTLSNQRNKRQKI